MFSMFTTNWAERLGLVDRALSAGDWGYGSNPSPGEVVMWTLSLSLSLTDKDSSTIRWLVVGENKERNHEKIQAAPSVRRNTEISAMFGKKMLTTTFRKIKKWILPQQRNGSILSSPRTPFQAATMALDRTKGLWPNKSPSQRPPIVAGFQRSNGIQLEVVFGGKKELFGENWRLNDVWLERRNNSFFNSSSWGFSTRRSDWWELEMNLKLFKILLSCLLGYINCEWQFRNRSSINLWSKILL